MSEAYRPPPASGSRPANDVDDDEAQAIRDEANGHDPAKPRWPEPSELALRLGTGGARLPLGLKHVDEAWRGGARMGAVLGVMGQPGAGKTTLLIFLTHNWVRGGIPVSFICADEDREGVIIRLGQQIGIQRKWLEDGLPSSRTDLADHLEGRPLMLLDPDEDDPLVDVSTAAEALRQRHPDGPAVLVFDSLQSLARRIPDVIADNARSKVDMCLKAMKSAAKRYGLLVVFTSEMNRGSYRMNDNSFSNDLAAGKESGSIEYEATAIMMLKTLPDDPGLVVVSFPKSRMGKVEPFALRQNYETATFASDRMPEPSTKRDPEAARSAAVEKACQLILEALEKEPMNKRALRAHVGGNASVVDSAVSELLRSGAISFTVGLRGAMLFDRVPCPSPLRALDTGHGHISASDRVRTQSRHAETRSEQGRESRGVRPEIIVGESPHFREERIGVNDCANPQLRWGKHHLSTLDSSARCVEVDDSSTCREARKTRPSIDPEILDAEMQCVIFQNGRATQCDLCLHHPGMTPPA